MGNSLDSLSDLRRALELFVSGSDQSQEFVRGNIGELLERFPEGKGFPDEQLFEDMETAVACYRPGGGTFMYNEEQMTVVCKHALAILFASRH